jgi:hypothetical protein
MADIRPLTDPDERDRAQRLLESLQQAGFLPPEQLEKVRSLVRTDDDGGRPSVEERRRSWSADVREEWQRSWGADRPEENCDLRERQAAVPPVALDGIGSRATVSPLLPSSPLSSAVSPLLSERSRSWSSDLRGERHRSWRLDLRGGSDLCERPTAVPPVGLEGLGSRPPVPPLPSVSPLLANRHGSHGEGPGVRPEGVRLIRRLPETGDLALHEAEQVVAQQTPGLWVDSARPAGGLTEGEDLAGGDGGTGERGRSLIQPGQRAVAGLAAPLEPQRIEGTLKVDLDRGEAWFDGHYDRRTRETRHGGPF